MVKINKKAEKRVLKVGSRVRVQLICEITGKPFDVGVEVVQTMDTDILLEFKAKKWYKEQTPDEKQAIAKMLGA